MTSPSTLSAGELRATLVTYGELLRAHEDVINRLNVYPVPDGDTGTNMALTIESVTNSLATLEASAPLSEVTKTIAHASLMGARGNSGVILSQLLRGLVASFSLTGPVNALELAQAFERADELARQAVVRPVEGTMLSIARAAAQGARANAHTLEGLVRSARDAAKEALARTPDQLAVLKDAGVVDSGATGLVLFYEALCHVVVHDELPSAPALDTIDVHVTHQSGGESALTTLAYEVMYFLAADDNKMPAFRDVWAGLGDSIAIVGGDGLYNCHIHTDDVGAAIEASLDVGRPREIRVTNLADQVLEERWVREAGVTPRDTSLTLRTGEPAPTTSVVAVVVGEGIGRIFHSLGVRQLVFGGQSMNPSAAELVSAVRETGSSQVIILPNNKNVVAVAQSVDELVEQDVSVVATNSVMEGFAALLAYDPDATVELNAPAMTVSARNVVTGEITRAVRSASCEVGEVHEGDWIGLGAQGILTVSDSLAVASTHLLALLLQPEHELVTIIEGDGSTSAITRRVTQFLSEEFPRVTVEVHQGGQPLYPYFFGLE